MAFDFPSSPTSGQIYSAHGVDWIYNGYLWLAGNAPLPVGPAIHSASLNETAGIIDVLATLGPFTLAWTSVPTELTNLSFSITPAPLVGDIVTLSLSLNSDMSSPFDTSDANTVDSGEAAAGSITFTGITTPLTAGLTYARVAVVRGASSADSTIASITLTGAADTTAPVLSSPTGTKTGATTATLTVSTDEANGTLYGCNDPSIDAITITYENYNTTIGFGRTTHQKSAQHFISVGSEISSIRLWLRRSSTIPADGVQVKIFTTDAGHNPTATQVGVTSNTISASSLISADTTACDFIFSPPVPVTLAAEYCFVVERTGALNDTVNCSIARADSSSVEAYASGYYHYLDAASAWVNTLDRDILCVINQGGVPSKAQIKAGQTSTGAASSYAFNQAVSTTGVQTKNATGLTASTSYTMHYMHEDTAGNQSNVASASAFTTDAAGGGPVVFDAASERTDAGGVTTQTWTHTPVGTPTGVVVAIAHWHTVPLIDPTSVTYGGVAMTQEAAVSQTSRLTLYSLANPPVGAQNVVISYSKLTYPVSGCISVTGGSTTDVLRTPPTPVTGTAPTGSASTATITVPSAAGELVVDAIFAYCTGLTVGAGQTQRVAPANIGSQHFRMSTEAGAAPNTVMTWTNAGGTDSNAWAYVGASFNPA